MELHRHSRGAFGELGNKFNEAGSGSSIRSKRKSSDQTVTMGTNTMKRSVAKIKKRRSIEKLMENDSNLRRIIIPREKRGGFGFNLRGMSGDKGTKQNRGQYIRSVDFEGNAHKWGLCAGDRILAVNDIPCCDETHEVVKALIQQSREQVILLVVKDINMELHAKKITESLLDKQHNHVIDNRTGIPHFTVEMTDKSLGRTRMLQERLLTGYAGQSDESDRESDAAGLCTAGLVRCPSGGAPMSGRDLDSPLWDV
eukprot:m.128128 g.128128  ORF g.128128 m.128128 type:complete len:255 (+) comp17418_c0_seq3:47-811(+)